MFFLILSSKYKEATQDEYRKSIDALFVFENYYTGDGSEIARGALKPETVSFEEQTEFNITVTVMKNNEGYSIRTSYAEEMYTRGEAEGFTRGYISVLESVNEGATQIKDISVLTTEEQEAINKMNEIISN